MRDLARIPDGGVLAQSATGLAIIRRQKHEPIKLPSDRDAIIRATGRRYGSKFDEAWTLAELVEWIKSVVDTERWPFEPGLRRVTHRVFETPVGLVAGQAVHTIEVVSDGRYVHAYPVEDKPS